jgi:hypothetical protein
MIEDVRNPDQERDGGCDEAARIDRIFRISRRGRGHVDGGRYEGEPDRRL